MSDDPRPLLLYDGECAFCRRWAGRFRAITGERVAYAAWQEVAARFPEVPPERFAEAVHLREPDGRWSRGAEAAFRALAATPGWGAPARAYARWAWFARASEAAYRWVARHRGTLARLPFVGA